MNNQPTHQSTHQLVANRRVRFDFTILDTLVCGVELQGSEVKSIRNKMLHFTDSYVQIKNSQLYIINLHISPYTFASGYSPDPIRPRRLLAHSHEITRLYKQVQEKGRTLMPLDIHTKGGLIKITVALCAGKKKHEKRAVIANRDIDRETQREIKRIGL